MSSGKVDNDHLQEDPVASGELLLGVEEMPMPMDSQEALQGFADVGTAVEPLDGNNGSSIISNKEDAVVGEGWYKRYCRWVPTSAVLLEQSEKKVLSYVKTAYEGRWVDIGAGEKKSNCKWSLWGKPEDRKVWTLVFNKEAEKTPLVFIHGLCASAGLWSLNIDALVEERPLYAIDLIGFGRSSRPRFSSDPSEAELQHVEAIEAWRKEMNLEKFVLLGHSMGGFISSAYALKYPERVAHLILADPWGFPAKPENVETVLPINKKSLRVKVATTIGPYVNPLGLVRAAGPYGPGLIAKVRPDLVSKFSALNQDGAADVAQYIYHCNAQNPTGEEAFRTMMNLFGWAKNPMVNRFRDFQEDMPMTLMYGDTTWLPHIHEDEVKQMRPKYTEVHIIPNAGHHIYADNQNVFNSIVNKAAAIADKFFHPNRISTTS